LKAFRPMRVYEITLSREAQSVGVSREAVPNSNHCIRVGTACDKGVWPFEAATRDGRSAQIAAIRRGLGERIRSTRRRPSRLVLGTEGMRT
jgi:hypothetical protein